LRELWHLLNIGIQVEHPYQQNQIISLSVLIQPTLTLVHQYPQFPLRVQHCNISVPRPILTSKYEHITHNHYHQQMLPQTKTIKL
jgi:hypothetical protein